MTAPTCFCGLPAPGLGEPGVHVEIAGQMDPAALGYALDELRHLASHHPEPVDSVRLTLRAPRRADHVLAEATLSAGDRVVRAQGTAGAPRGAIDAILRRLRAPATA
ncbi:MULTISPECIES: hypothetical protein [unclassified Amycolatopsis]|uniref:hypothetical protein n=1 Tax=Amycolatopsis TaxID=1813 RepID=UPI0002627D15|nr:hypothetical protein [Amycolatopsis sp. ATCC 39116]